MALMLSVLMMARVVMAAPTEAKDSPPDADPGPATQPVPYLSAEEAIKTMNLAEPSRFRVEVFASEPMIEHPVFMTFDADGRMWVVEMVSYMPNPEGTGEKSPTGRITVLEDTDGDGRADKRTVFMDTLSLPRAVAPVRDGVLVGYAPNLVWCRDTNGDLRADEQTIVTTDFGLVTNPESDANGLLTALDNWIYCACYNKRFKWIDGKWTTDFVPSLGQWGITQDDYGRLFHNSNSDHLRGSPVPPHYVDRNSHYKAAGANERIADDQTVWPAHNTAVNRGYTPGFLREGDKTLKAYTAACSPAIYRGGLFGKDVAGNAFVCEPIANLVRRSVITEQNGYLTAKNAYADRKVEFIASTYERFRPVNIQTGPDGAIYIADMHHGLLQHATHLTTHAKAQYLQRELQKHLGTGRIYRVVPTEGKLYERPALSKASVPQLVAALSHPNGWWRDTAQRLLVERGDFKVVAPLRKVITSSDNAMARLHAMWTLEGMGVSDPPTVRAMLKDPVGKNRAAGIRWAERLLVTDNKSQIIGDVMKLAGDADSDVRQQFALTMSAIGGADAQLAHSILMSDENSYVGDAVLSGLRGRELEFLSMALGAPQWTGKTDAKVGVLTALAQCVVNEGVPARVARVLDLAAAQKDWRQLALLDGFPEPVKGRKAKSILMNAEPAGLAAIRATPAATTQPVNRLLARVEQIVHWPGQAGYVPPKPPPPLTAMQQARFEAGRVIFSSICAQCHQPDGMGKEGTAPPLVGSEWVLGPERRIARIVLHGLRGPITVGGKTYTYDMPAIPTMDDEQIAAVLTYIRREWEHEASAVEPKTVAEVRREGRGLPWTERELLRTK